MTTIAQNTGFVNLFKVFVDIYFIGYYDIDNDKRGVEMKRIIAQITLLCLFLSGCMLAKTDDSTDTTAPLGDDQANVLLDENGNRIGTVLFYQDEQGRLLKEELKFDDGSFVLREYGYSSDGRKIKCDYVYSDGTTGVETYYESGSLKMSTAVLPDGTTKENTFYENGSLLAYTVIYADGTKTGSTYSENGNQQTSAALCADGTTVENIYYESGKLRSVVIDGPGGQYEYHYKEDGTPADGEDRRDRDTPNCFYDVKIDGEIPGVQTRYYDENGYLRMFSNEYEDGSGYGEGYYSNGVMKETNAKGALESVYWSFHPNGAAKQYKRDTEEKLYTVDFYPDGRFAAQSCWYRTDGIYVETQYDEVGNITYVTGQ